MEGEKQSSSNVKYLPMELVTKILHGLLVKSLLRFRRVCKSWHSLISSPDFAYVHLAHCHEDDDDDNTPILTFVRHTFIGHGVTDIWTLRSAHTFKKLKSIRDNGFKCPDNYLICGNSVNGLLLLSNYYTSYIPALKEIMLWNPIIGRAHRLPSLKICKPTFGFGFNLVNNDYKVVAIAKHPSTSVHLYTLNTNTWRSLVDYEESMISHVHSDLHGVLIQGSIFWVTMVEAGRSHLVSFDVKDEAFDYITLPSGNSLCSRRPVAYREWVGLLDLGFLGNYSCTLWVMEKEQVPQTWSKLYTINLEQRCMPKILCFKKNGQLIFATREAIKLCDMETQHMKNLVKNNSFYHQKSITVAYCTLYRESLVLLQRWLQRGIYITRTF